MAISEFHESTIVSVSASFGFAQFACPPEEITRELGIEPDLTVTKGSARRILSGRKTGTAPFSTWSISSSCDSKDVNEHLRELCGRLGSAKRSFDPAWGEPTFGVTWKGNYLYAGSGPFYERDVIERIAALGASLYQDIYQVDEEDEEPDGDDGLSRIPKRFFSR